MGSNDDQSHTSEMSEEIEHLLNSSMSGHESYLLQNGDFESMLGLSANLSHSTAQTPHQEAQFVHGKSSRTNTEERSMVAEAMSSFSGVPYLSGNGSNSTDLLASNCGRNSVSLTGDQSPSQQKTFQAGQIHPRWCGSTQGEQLPGPTFSPPMMIPAQQASIPPYMNLKKPRLEMTQEEFMLAASIRRQSPNQVPMQLTSSDPGVAARLHQQNLARIQQQNTTPPCVPSPERHQMQCLPPQQFPRDAQKQISAVNGSLCLRRLMYFMYQQRHRPSDNNIDFWKKFVKEYFSPRAKRRWCMPNSNKACRDIWKCNFCGSNSGKGYEVQYELLPRIFKTNFDYGVIDELMYIDSPIERLLPSGLMMLWFNKAVQESIYSNLRVVHKGQLRVIFTPDLKILSWEFCMQRYDELISRSLAVAQVNDSLEIAAKCKIIAELNQTEGAQGHDMVESCNRVMAAGHKLATSMELPLLDGNGISKHFIRNLQISEGVHQIKGLIAECAASKTNNFSPIAALKRACQKAADAKVLQNLKSRADMQQTPTADSNIQSANIMTPTPNAVEQPMLTRNCYQKSLPKEHMRTSDSYQSTEFHPSPLSSSGPPSSQQVVNVEFKVNDLLAQMRADGTAKDSKTARGSKRGLVYDPNINPEVVEFYERKNVGEVEIEENTSYRLGGMMNKGKGFNYSSSSNSDGIMKKETVSDDNTSAIRQQQG